VRRNSGSHGFSLAELLIAMALMVVVTSAFMTLVLSGGSIARAQPEAWDLHQRARIAMQTLGAELARAGAGLDRGPQRGPLSSSFAPLEIGADGSLTVWYVNGQGGQTSLASALAAGDAEAMLANAGDCPASRPACAFTSGSTGILFQPGGARDALRIDDVRDMSLTLRAGPQFSYSAGASIAEGEVRTYRVDPIARQLLRRDEATGTSLPVIDGIAAMSAELHEEGGIVRVTLRLVGATTSSDLVVAFDVLMPNMTLAGGA
jgi:prepilin-type N-terminal cleavage/methylation domain-containing protein